ncbi:MAG: hypothetical protein K8R35_05665 [Bacteroidales bacterium]|nr:hypothetical protein [Bacteroidales bacterium]
MKNFLLTVLFIFVYSLTSIGQNDYYFPGKTSFNTDIMTPEEFMGYPVGSHHTRYDKMVEYLKYLSDESDRASFGIFGYSVELRPQVILTITAPSNYKNLEDIRIDHLKLSDPGQPVDNIESMPVIVQLGFNVHGNEPSGGEASLLTAYYLVASEEAEIDGILNNSVIFIEPILNPDGRERFTNWVNRHKSTSPVSDPADIEHTEAWPGGRTNHYWFDLNRDWLPVSQVESQNRLKRFHKWRPNLITDHHEMGSNSTFFFEPTKKGTENRLVPDENYLKLNKLFAEKFSEALDEIDHYYDSGRSFDNSYPGYGSSYADLNGGLALLFEQASTRGLVRETDLGYKLHYKLGIQNQLFGALTALRTAVENRVMLNDYMRRFYRDAVKESKSDSVKAYVFGDPKDRSRTHLFIDLLNYHKIEVYELENDISTPSGNFRGGSAYVVPVEQPQYKMIRTMFEAVLEFNDSLFYDASAWAMIYAYGLPFSGLSRLPQIGINPVSDAGFEIKEIVYSDYGYIFDWSDYFAVKALWLLQEKGIKLRGAWDPVTIETDKGVVEFGRGSVFIPVQYQDLNAGEVNEIVSEISKLADINIYSISTSMPVTGPWIGNNSFRSLTAPKVLMLIGSGVSGSNAGELWHLFDTRINMPVTKVDIYRLGRINLGNYNTIIIPSGRYHALSKDFITSLNEWVNNGGNLIAIGSAVTWLAKEEFVSLETMRRDNDNSKRLDYNIARFESGKHLIRGVFCKSDLDNTHPLGFGYSSRNIITYKNSTVFIKPVEANISNIAIYKNDPVISGFITKENEDLIEKSVSLISVRKGRGNITLFIDNPVFRCCWLGTNKLLMNAIFFGNNM